MSQIKVVRKANGDIALSVVATKYHNWGERCTTSGCSAAVYDLTEMWYSPDTTDWTDSEGLPARRVAKPFFTLGEKGDSRFSFHELQFSDDAYLTETTLFAPNTWGEDLDARALRPSLEPSPDRHGGVVIRSATITPWWTRRRRVTQPREPGSGPSSAGMVAAAALRGAWEF